MVVICLRTATVNHRRRSMGMAFCGRTSYGVDGLHSRLDHERNEPHERFKQNYVMILLSCLLQLVSQHPFTASTGNPKAQSLYHQSPHWISCRSCISWLEQETEPHWCAVRTAFPQQPRMAVIGCARPKRHGNCRSFIRESLASAVVFSGAAIVDHRHCSMPPPWRYSPNNISFPSWPGLPTAECGWKPRPLSFRDNLSAGRIIYGIQGDDGGAFF
ncbi:hypothetical protein RRSWK_00130 [Rhodopirellula sp. SWK7]|nr:hypothetical protein RRSWK_00130 [Rhodopirellula sp. SWK7]